LIQNKKKLVTWGLYLGITHVLLGALLYAAGAEYMSKWWVGLSMLAIFIVIHFVFAFRYRKDAGGIMNYWQGYVASFSIGMLAGLMSSIFNLVLVGVIDPGLPEKIKTASIKNTVEMMEGWNVPAEEIEKTIASMEEGFNEQDNGVMGQVKGIMWQAVGSGIFAFIVAAFLRKKPRSGDPSIDNVVS